MGRHGQKEIRNSHFVFPLSDFRGALARMVLDRLLAWADRARAREQMDVDSYQEEEAPALVDLDPRDRRAFAEESAVFQDLRC